MKQYCVVSCPIDTYSGYGARSRDFVKALYELKKDEWEIEILAQRWGATPWNYIKENSKDWNFLEPHINKTGQLTRQPDIWIQITIPNEFQSVGKFNIGVTAGIETTICHASWIDGLNRMNLNLVSSEFTKETFVNSRFEEKDQNTQQTVRKIELTAPVEVLFEGVNVDIYKKLDAFNGEVNDTLEDLVAEDFNFLYVGHWLQGELGQDRKDTGMLIKTFLETFKDKKTKPGLIVKTSSATYSVLDREEILDKIRRIQESIGGDLPNIYLLHGELSDEEVNELYNHPKVKASVSFTKGEGYGRPLLEASISQKPVIASGWSGHTDFLDPEMAILLPGAVVQIHPSAVVQDMLIAESGWFTIDYSAATKALEDVYKNYKKWIDKSKRQAYRSRTEFSLDKMGEKLLSIIDNKVPIKVELKLPQLKKIELPKKPA